MTKTERLRELLSRSEIVRSFAPHDVFSARVLEDAGVEMLFLGGFGVSASAFGLPDVGLVTLTEMTDAVRRMSDATSVPLIADGDTGHGNLRNVARTVRDFERAGASGLLIEDQVSPKRCGHFSGKQVIPVGQMLEKLRIVLGMRGDPNFVIIARTDARAVEGLDAAIERANRYGEAGADMCFIDAPESREELERIGREVAYPQLVNMLPGGVTPILSASELEQFGFRIVVDPVATLMAGGHATRALAAAMQTAGRIDQAEVSMFDFEEVKRLLRAEQYEA